MTLPPGAKPRSAEAPLWKRHFQALAYVLTVLLPAILRTGKRPVIFSKYSGIGDIICTFPAALELKKRHPGVEFIYNCHPNSLCLPRLGGVTNHATSLVPIGLIGYWYRFLLSGYYNFASDDDRPGQNHRDVYIRDFGNSFGVDLDGSHPRLHQEPSVINRVKTLLEKEGISAGPIITIHLGPTWPVKEWPHARWVNLVGELSSLGYSQIVRLGTDHHLSLGQVRLEEIPGVVSLVNQLDLEESIALIELSNLFIGIDSGLLHVAAAARKPAVGLWGATSPRFLFSIENQPYFVVSQVDCQGCHHRVPRLHWITGCPYEIKCMKEIPVSEVLRQCQAALKA